MVRIKIAPDLDEIFVEGNVMRTDFASGITYTAEGLDNYKPEYLKEVFQTAIAMAGKRWILEDCLNNFLHLEGKIS
jgi:hypothetical protein